MSVRAGPGSTSCTPGWERLGDEGRTFRDANTNGWQSLIPSYVVAATRR